MSSALDLGLGSAFPNPIESAPSTPDDNSIIVRRALQIVESKLSSQPLLTQPAIVKDYLRLRVGTLPYEVLGVLWMDAAHRLICVEELFRGTVAQCSAYPREVARHAVIHNASAVILFHNHPSGITDPSRADELLTTTIKSVLSLLDVRLLDHIIVGSSQCTSMAEMGLI
jgi:DNA repair protein RadC